MAREGSRERENDGRVLLHDEIADILHANGTEWMTTREVADQLNARGRYIKEDRSKVRAFQVKLRAKNYPHLFDRDGSRVRLKVGTPTSPALTLNVLLRAAGLDPANVRLVRHRDKHHHREVFDAARRNDPRFVCYQETQDNPRVLSQFRSARYLAGFVADPMSRDTVFVGIGERKSPWASSDMPAAIQVSPEAISFETRRVNALSEYSGRLVIDWCGSERVWVQHADQQDKPVLELRRVASDPPFPGFLDVKRGLDQVASIPETWATALRNARGVYLIVHRDRGDQYVGSAVGGDGFFGRWLGYADGHGGNVGMRELAAQAGAYEVSILEVVGSAASIDEVYARESAWKEKLGTRAKGLNRN